MKEVKRVLKFITFGLIALFLCVGVFTWATSISHLDAPIIKNDKLDVGKSHMLTGLGYPGAKIAVFIDGNYVKDIEVLSNGSFGGEILFDADGTHKVKVKQLLRNISSEFSDEISLKVDATPPAKGSFILSSTPPEFSKEKTLEFAGSGNPKDVVLVSGQKISIGEDGKFAGSIQLSEGENSLEFLISDSVGNSIIAASYKVTVDSFPPRVITSFCGSKPTGDGYTPVGLSDLKSSEEVVCISTGQWEDWRDPAPIPIVGYVVGDIGSITVDGKKILPDENGEIFQRVYLPVPKGLNKYKVIVSDKYGNKTSDNITMTVQSVRDSDYDEVMDKLDEIDSRI